ncbi:MAG TPA: DegV family protein [Candidatus Binatus sp.]|nr:DegV family protein [Candidatus Binatus sp.]
MSRVAVVTDSASDLSPARAAALGITIVPLVVNFGSQAYKAGVDIFTDEFWARMTAPDAPFPTTAAASPGDFQVAYERCFADGADSIVSIHVAGTLSGSIKSAQVAAGLLAGREIHVVDSMLASMGQGVLAELAVEMTGRGSTGAEIAAAVTARREDIGVYLALDTLEYLRRGGRISGTQAAIGTLLAVKPIIKIADGLVETVDRVRTKGKARERLIELLCTRPMERLSVLHTTNAGVDEFVSELVARVPGGIDPARVTVDLVGPSVGPHLGPGCVGGVALYRS